jgi:hypothetical protein
MIKNLAGVAISLAMMGGMAAAQTTTSTETTTTRSTTNALPPIAVAPAPGVVNESKTQTTIDSSGRETEKSDVYKSGDGRTESSSSVTVKEPDGSVQSQHHEEWRVTPEVQTTTTTRSTSTTTDR